MSNIVLRDYQSSFISDIKKQISLGNKRLIACASTGAGKSICLAAIAKSALEKNKIILIILPRKSLVMQLSRTFESFKISHSVLMGNEPYYSQARCQIISIDTYTSRLSRGRINHIYADLICLDEQHVQHTEAKIDIFNKYPVVIGFTATPDCSKKRPLNLLYSKIVESISMKELVELGHLVPLRYFAPTDFHPESVKLDQDGEYNSRQLDDYIDEKLKTEDGKLKLVGDIISNWKRIAHDRQTVVFCKTQAHSRFVCDEFCANGVNALYIDCNTPTDEREHIFNAIASKKAQVLVNVGIVAIGIDIPILSCVILATPINKISKYLQCVGRLTRPHKESGKVDGIVIDHAGIVANLGFADDKQYWSLDGKETPEQLKKEVKEDNKEPKEITCQECGAVFKSRRDCPVCGFESVPESEEIPFHESELKEVKKENIRPQDKQIFYAELLGYAKQKRFKEGWCSHKFKEKFGHFPAKKKGIHPIQPSQETLNYIKYLNIKRAKSK